LSSTPGQLRARNLRMLGGLAGLFLLPLLASFWMYYGTDWRPASRVNHGELITPVRPLAQVNLPIVLGNPGHGALFRHTWSLVYVGRGSCEESCRQSLYVMRQARLALNNDMTRVERVFLASADCCDRNLLTQEHSGIVVVDASGADSRPLLSAFPETDRERSLFVVDPLGNLMMRFDTRQDAKGLLQDLQKLLRLSSIG
jgi:hypothetical protein